MSDTMCVNPVCRHTRRVHSKNGCGEIVDMRTGRECPCRVPYMEVGKRAR